MDQTIALVAEFYQRRAELEARLALYRKAKIKATRLTATTLHRKLAEGTEPQEALRAYRDTITAREAGR